MGGPAKEVLVAIVRYFLYLWSLEGLIVLEVHFAQCGGTAGTGWGPLLSILACGIHVRKITWPQEH